MKNLIDLTKRHWEFLEFLDIELELLGLEHQYNFDSKEGYCIDHTIYRKEGNIDPWSLLATKAKEKKPVAQIVAEPATPIHNGWQDGLKIKIYDQAVWPQINKLIERFREKKFGVEAQIVP